MNRKMIFIAIVTLALASLACSVNINLPSTQVKTGPTVTESIKVPLLADNQATADVSLQFGAGKLTLQPGAKDALIDGTVIYNVTDFKPDVTIDNENISIEQGNLDFKGLPSFTSDIVNEWILNLGNSPMNLSIKAGAYTGNYELGGLSIERLEVGDGAAKVNLSFSQPNQIVMRSLLYTTGASEVTLKGLANTNASDFTFRSGAGSYTLDFSGELRSDMYVNIESGVSTVKVIVPKGVAAKIISETGLMTVSTSGDWHQSGNTYQQTGSGNTINIQVKMGAGNLKLETANQ